MSSCDDDKRSKIYLSKAKYKAFNENLDEMFVGNGLITADVKDALLACLCDVFKFDPNKSSYDRERVERIKKETGQSTYNKKYYENNKEEIDRKNVERTRMRRAAMKLNKLQLASSSDVAKS